MAAGALVLVFILVGPQATQATQTERPALLGLCRRLGPAILAAPPALGETLGALTGHE